MKHSAIDMTGQTFNWLTAIRRVANNAKGQAVWLCKCVCGKEHEVAGVSLRAGTVKSCGCRKVMVDRGRSRRAKGRRANHIWDNDIEDACVDW